MRSPAALRALALLAGLAIAPLAHAVEPDEILADPKLEARARDLSSHLRCMVCQNESIDDSKAPLAKDLRLLVRERLTAGDSDDAIRAYLVSRYGDFILLKPPLKIETLALWGAPLVIFLGGVAAIVVNLRRRASVAAPDARGLDADEQARLAAALAPRDDPRG